MIQPNIAQSQPSIISPLDSLSNQSSLRTALGLTLIKSALARKLLLQSCFAFKQIQIQGLRVKRSREVFQLQQRCDDSFSSGKSPSVHRQKSLDVLRNIKTSLERQRGFRSSSGLLGLHGLAGQKSKIMEEIAKKLDVKNHVPEGDKTPQSSPLSKRVAKLQNFMLLIKRERELNDKPAVILEKKRINRINYHMLSEKLAEERQKSQENRQKEIMGNLRSIKEELKSIQKVQEMIVKNPESSVEVSQVSGQSKQSGKDRQSQGATRIIMDLPLPPSNPNIAPLKFSRPPIRFVSGSQPQRKIIFWLISPP